MEEEERVRWGCEGEGAGKGWDPRRKVKRQVPSEPFDCLCNSSRIHVGEEDVAHGLHTKHVISTNHLHDFIYHISV